ncbi:MAG: class I SAM-dependent methyltransferase [Candidatus Heimdallarchaeota archaeon]|nr:MAG: class I SAM-dependent methyltransferase [Candidatus Heimdallarchaeota archaeon]
MATILMTLAEKKAPSKYEWLINFLTLGRREKIFKYIKQNYLQENQILLDAGCGTGRFMELAETAWVKPIIGIDISYTMVREARMKYLRRNLPISLIQASIASLPVKSELFDVIVCTLVLSELTLQQVRVALKEFSSCLKNEGVIILVTESKPKSRLNRLIFGILRAPAFFIAALIAKIPTHPIHDVKSLLDTFPGEILEHKIYLGGNLTLITFKKEKQKN